MGAGRTDREQPVKRETLERNLSKGSANNINQTTTQKYMCFVDLPSYAEARKDGYRPLKDLDNGMGDTVGMVERFLKDETESTAETLDIEYELENDRFEVLVSPREEKVVVYDEFYEESLLPITGAVILECEDSGPGKAKGRNSQKKEYRVPTNGGETYIDETNLRAAAQFHEFTVT